MSRQFKTNYLKKQRQRYLKRTLLFLLFVVLVGAIVYVVMFSSFFNIENIKIVGAKRVPSELIQKEVDAIIHEENLLSLNNNLFFVKDQKIKQILLADINNIYVTKNFFTKTLNVHVVEKKPIAKIILLTDETSAFVDSVNGNMYLDDSGRIFRSTLINEDKITNIVIKKQNNNLPSNILDQEKTNYFLNLINHLNSNPNYINNFEFEYSLNTPSAIILKLKGYYRALITLNKDIVNAFNAAEGFYEKESRNKNVISSYIDMRYYPEKLYYK